MAQPTIVIVAYNRPESLKRLLGSISRANFDNYSDIKLIISIDGGGGLATEKIAKSFNWKIGEKEIIQHSTNLGLRNHIISCGDLTFMYDSVIILEDDCFVSRNFYDYTSKALSFYKNDKRIAGISLYSNRYNEVASLPFAPLYDGKDIFFMQIPSSWGQAWTKSHWKGFKNFYDKKPKITPEDKIPESVKNWSEKSWKKYYYKYIIQNNLYFVYPRISYSTNFSDIGEHWNEAFSFFQVPLEFQLHTKYEFITMSESNNIYDGYFELLPKCLSILGAEIDLDTCIDIYGTKQIEHINNEYLLSIKKCSLSEKAFSIKLNPIVQNVLHNLKGAIISYSKKKYFDNYVSSNTLHRILQIQQPVAYHSATKSKYYKFGYFLAHPYLLLSKILNRIKKDIKCSNYL